MKDYLAKAIYSLCPNAEFVIFDNDYSTIQWHVLEGTAPTRAEIDAEIAKIKAQEEAELEAKETAKADLLAKLGISADEAKLLLS